MFSIINNEIKITRGDTAFLRISVTRGDKTKYSFEIGDILYLTVKENTNEIDFLIQKIGTFADLEDGDVVIKLLPTDTEFLQYKKYIYDIELRTSIGDVFTIIPPSGFNVMPEVTFASNEVG